MEDDEGVGSAGRPRSHLPATRPFALGGAQLLGSGVPCADAGHLTERGPNPLPVWGTGKALPPPTVACAALPLQSRSHPFLPVENGLTPPCLWATRREHHCSSGDPVS
jgi:hypothetical protein